MLDTPLLMSISINLSERPTKILCFCSPGDTSENEELGNIAYLAFAIGYMFPCLLVLCCPDFMCNNSFEHNYGKYVSM